MKIVAISDTHGQHEALQLPKGDLLIHAGDLSKRGTEQQVRLFLDWFAAQDFRHKIFIAGNHDFFFERESGRRIAELIPPGVIYLNDSMAEVEGLRIWGSPVQPWFYDWAFNRRRGEEIRKHWDLIPENTDVLITHGPAAGIHDLTIHGEHVGCVDLLARIEALQPRLFICGHIHEAHGILPGNPTTFINASVLDEQYILRHPPVEIELK